ncbi:MAG: hypothetical protein ACRC8A_11755 [Microcoleaceae cyanobacterium]
MLEITLGQLVNKTEKNWGYFQVHKRGEFYILNILGRGDDVLRFQCNETTNSYRFFWYKRPNPSVFVRSKTIKPGTPDYKTVENKKTQKSYQVHYQTEANSVESSINRRIAQLVKSRIVVTSGSEGSGLVSVLQE